VGAIGISFSSRVRSVASDAASHEVSHKQDCGPLVCWCCFFRIEEVENDTPILGTRGILFIVI